MKKRNSLQSYKKLLPDKLTVEIHRTKEGSFWAKIKELSHCYTQAKSSSELIVMLNDAIYTYLGIPKRYYGKLGYYVPQRLYGEIKRMHWQKIVQEMIRREQLRRRLEVFKLHDVWERSRN